MGGDDLEGVPVASFLAKFRMSDIERYTYSPPTLQYSDEGPWVR